MIIRCSRLLGIGLVILALCLTNCQTVAAETLATGSDPTIQFFVLPSESPTDDPNLSISQVVLTSGSTLTLQWDSVPPSVRYVLFQAHAQRRPLTLAQQPTLASGNHVNATDPGLLVQLTPGQLTASAYLLNPHDTNVTVLLVAAGYSDQDPVVGACNMEFDMEVAPYLRLRMLGFTSLLEFQRSRSGSARDAAIKPTCDSSLSVLDYSVYQYFMQERQLAEEEYFRAIRTMLSVNSIQSNAVKIHATQTGPSTRSSFNALPGQGVVFNVVVRDFFNRSFVAAYTPAATYACDLDRVYDTCSLQILPFGWIFCVVCFFVGFFLCFFGHRFFMIEMFIFGFLTFSLVAFVTVTKFTVSTYTARVSLTMVMGGVGGATWVVLWWFAGVPVVSVLLVGLDLGFMLACVVFYTPFGRLAFLSNDENYWLTFTCITLIPGLFLSCTMHKLSILTCAVIGSYGAVLLLDLYLGTSLVYIVLNVIKRAVIDDFSTLNTQTPFQINEMALVAVWIFLVIAGTTVQVVRERHRPPFPPPPYLVWRQMTESAESSEYLGSSDSSSSAFINVGDSPISENDERSPLLAGAKGSCSYGTSTATPLRQEDTRSAAGSVRSDLPFPTLTRR